MTFLESGLVLSQLRMVMEPCVEETDKKEEGNERGILKVGREEGEGRLTERERERLERQRQRNENEREKLERGVRAGEKRAR